MKIRYLEIIFIYCDLYCIQIKTNEKHSENEFSTLFKYTDY